VVSGTEKAVRALETEGVKKVPHFIQSVGNVRLGVDGWLPQIQKEKSTRESSPVSRTSKWFCYRQGVIIKFIKPN